MQLLVSADDRTGAWETAAALADAGAGSVDVAVWPSVGADSPVVVVDLATRHLDQGEARLRVLALGPAARSAHKIDSTLRGNWPEELAALAESSPVLVIPALPALGRTCVGGVVLEHGRPVHESSAGRDIRRRVTTSRPAESLLAADVGDVGELADQAAVAAWLADPRGVRIADAADGPTIEVLVTMWNGGPADVVLAGTSAVIAATVERADRTTPVAGIGPIASPLLVACGSVHPAARRQLADVERRGIAVATVADDATIRAFSGSTALVLATEIPVGDVDEPLAVAAATVLARGVADLCRHTAVGALILIGGDTAAAVLGDSAATIHGSLTSGTAWATVDGFPMPVITRAGGFGGESALFDLISGILQA